MRRCLEASVRDRRESLEKKRGKDSQPADKSAVRKDLTASLADKARRQLPHHENLATTGILLRWAAVNLMRIRLPEHDPRQLHAAELQTAR